MSSYDIEQEETLATLKDWWKKHSTKVLAVLAVVAVVVIGYRGYQYYLQSQSEKAAILFESAIDSRADTPLEARRSAFDRLLADHSDSILVPRAAIVIAQQLAIDNKPAAIQLLQNTLAIQKDKTLDGFLRLHLVQLMREEGKLDDALTVLTSALANAGTDTDTSPEVNALLLDKKGDILWEKGSLSEALEVFNAAMVQWTASSLPNPGYIQLKINAVQGAL